MSTHSALFELGMDLEAPSTTHAEEHTHVVRDTVSADERKDHFVVKNGVKCAGTHLIIDLHDAENLDDLEHIEKTLVECVETAGATLLHIHLHRFEPNGISGVAVLAESHISIHSWPENGYAALDVFMCGDAVPESCIGVLRAAFNPRSLVVEEILRGKGV